MTTARQSQWEQATPPDEPITRQQGSVPTPSQALPLSLRSSRQSGRAEQAVNLHLSTRVVHFCNKLSTAFILNLCTFIFLYSTIYVKHISHFTLKLVFNLIHLTSPFAEIQLINEQRKAFISIKINALNSRFQRVRNQVFDICIKEQLSSATRTRSFSVPEEHPDQRAASFLKRVFLPVTYTGSSDSSPRSAQPTLPSRPTTSPTGLPARNAHPWGLLQRGQPHGPTASHAAQNGLIQAKYPKTKVRVPRINIKIPYYAVGRNIVLSCGLSVCAFARFIQWPSMLQSWYQL